MTTTRNTQIQVKLHDAVHDQAAVERILREASEKFRLFDNTATSKVPNTIRSIVEREHHGFGLGARIVNDLIVVDFFPHKNPAAVFNDVRKFVMDSLFLTFPNNVQEMKEGTFISLYG